MSAENPPADAIIIRMTWLKETIENNNVSPLVSISSLCAEHICA